MPLWFSESRRIEANVARVLVQDPAIMGRVGLKVARDDAKRLLDRISDYQKKIHKRGVAARTVSAANDGLTVVSGGVWAASLFGAAIFPPLALAASIATPVGAACAIGDRTLNGVRARRLDALETWYGQVNGHLVAINRRIDQLLINHHPAAPA